jgi:protease I
MQKKVLIPIPATDFDPTECAIPWKILKEAGIEVVFATPSGAVAQCDRRMLTGEGLGIFAPFLIADKNAQSAYQDMIQSSEFKNPRSWVNVNSLNYEGMILPGGHAPGMKEYLEAEDLQKIIREFFEAGKPLGAICHGVLLVARTHFLDGRSVLAGRKTTALLESQEYLAWALTSFWQGRYYRTYDMTVEKEVSLNLDSPKDFIKGPAPLLRDNPESLNRGFTVLDGNYLSARWPGDAYRFAYDFLKVIS